MLREDKERVVAELAEQLRTTQSLIVADYRGLTVKEIDALRTRLLEHGASFQVVKNTLTRRAAEAAGADAVLALLEGPTAIAFLETDGDPVAVAKALSETARTTRVLAIRGGILEGKEISADDVDELSKLPPLEILRGQVLGAVIAPLTQLLALVNAPLQNLYGLIEARIDQLGGEGAATTQEPEPAAEPEAEAAPEPEAEAAPDQEAEAAAEPEAEAAPAAEEPKETETQEEETDGGS